LSGTNFLGFSGHTFGIGHIHFLKTGEMTMTSHFSHRYLFLSVIIVSVFLFFGCSKDSSINPSANVSPTYSSISSVILQPGCVNCHGGAGGYSFDSYANTIKAVSAGNPSGSPLYNSVSAGRMPKNGTKLSQQQISAIGDWITANAPNN
jgi:hypothetical protein